MGWLADLFAAAKAEPPTDWTWALDLGPPADPGPAIVADQVYLELFVEALRLEKARRWGARFHALAYAEASVERQGKGAATLVALSAPAGLAALDPDGAARTITVSKRLIGPTPWRGGRLGLELALVSVKAGGVLTPLVDYVLRVADAAGLGQVAAAAPFLPLVSAGLDLLAGQTAERAIEIALDTHLTPTAPLTGAIVARPQGTLPPGRLSYDRATATLRQGGQPVDAGYLVFSIRSIAQKADFGDIPDLAAAYGEIVAAVERGRQTEAAEAAASFRRRAVVSPDLIPSDARRLIERVEALMRAAFPATGTAAARPAAMPPRLADVALYG